MPADGVPVSGPGPLFVLAATHCFYCRKISLARLGADLTLAMLTSNPPRKTGLAEAAFLACKMRGSGANPISIYLHLSKYLCVANIQRGKRGLTLLPSKCATSPDGLGSGLDVSTPALLLVNASTFGIAQLCKAGNRMDCGLLAAVRYLWIKYEWPDGNKWLAEPSPKLYRSSDNTTHIRTCLQTS